MCPQRHPATAIFLLPLFALLMAAGSVAAQCAPGKGRIWIGPPTDPERYYRFATDNGIPGSGRYAYSDHNWPSLRQALQQYGLFGRRFKTQNHAGDNVLVTPAPPVGVNTVSPGDRRTPPEETLLELPRKVGD